MKAGLPLSLLVAVLAISSVGCQARRQRKECREEAKLAFQQLEKALQEKLAKDYSFCPTAKSPVPAEMPKNAKVNVEAKLWEEESWKCLGFKPSSTYCQWTYFSNGKSDTDAEAMVTAVCQPADDGKIFKWELKLKGNLTGDAERISFTEPPAD